MNGGYYYLAEEFFDILDQLVYLDINTQECYNYLIQLKNENK